MTTIREILTSYYTYANQTFNSADAKYGYELAVNGGRLASDMNALALNHAGWEFFNAYWRRYDGRDTEDIYAPVHPDTLVAAAGSLGFVDVEPLTAWVDDLKHPMTGMVSRLSNGSSSAIALPYDTMPDISFSDLIRALRDNGANIAPDAVFHALDDVYKVPSLADVQVMLKNCPTRKMRYRASREDCDDFANQFKAWLGYLGYGNVAVGYIEMALLTVDGATTGAHAVNVVVYRDAVGVKASFIEPQTNALHDLSSVWVVGGIAGVPVSNRIYWIVF